jgi:hypothetical protein
MTWSSLERVLGGANLRYITIRQEVHPQHQGFLRRKNTVVHQMRC